MIIDIEVKYYEKVEIDLEDYGHKPKTKWTDLSDEEKNEILDPLREGKILDIGEITISDENFNN